LNDPLRVGIIGCGNITVNDHAPTLRGLEGVRMTAIADPTESRRQKTQALLGLPDSACFANHQALLDVGVDYVVLAVPQKFRRPIVEDCARAGVHVLSEKPIATVPADARAMSDVMRAANVRCGMIHNYLYYPEYKLARALIASGAIGQLRHTTLNFLGVPDSPGAADYRPRWRHDPAEAGGGILMDMIHAVYVAEFLVAEPVRAVSAIVDNLDHSGEAVEDFTLVTYHFDSGYATVNMGWGEGPGGVEIGGTGGRMMIFYKDYGTGPFQPLESFTLVNRAGRKTYEPRTGWQPVDNFKQIHADFVEAIRTGRDPIAPAEAGLRALEAVLAAYASAATGRVIPLPLSADDPVYQRGVMGLCELELWKAGPLVRRGVFGLTAT
jgi:predicted dehydrogenase